ncbi:uncharacterized protein LOC6542961 [Drosophila erecta]|uniref:Uncharacterized protein n=1 Tax=Drosophila erecta TaxID=7220 RepID=B3N860_DROER|nr:uncharacterized protein LOC6542961 [Drosophila erecta]EDV59473.1 uncharacterized protein Dere_GG23387 [Drosophila erecta]
MANSKSFKASNWPGILDSRHALRKYFAPPPKVAGTQGRLPTYTPPNYAGAEPMQQPRMNSAWQLASDPSDLSELRPPKRIKGLKDRERKKLERKVWARPARMDATSRAATSGPRAVEKAQKQEQVETPPKPRSPAKRKWKKGTTPSPLPGKRPAQVPSHSGFPRRKIILIVDAKRSPGTAHLAGGADKLLKNPSPGPERNAYRPRPKMSGRSKRSYNVPLCSRPTEIIGTRLPHSRQLQMRQEKLCQQPEYHDQYIRMLYQQQRHQQMCQQEQLQQDFARQRSQMALHPYSILPDAVSEDQREEQRHLYSVPSKSPLKRLRGGKRLCGNFYYD